MSLTIGRFGITPALTSAKVSANTGRRLAFEGNMTPASLADGIAMRDLLIGHCESADEEIVPVVWSADPAVNGYYRLVSANVPAGQGDLAHGFFQFSAELERVNDHESPLFESIVIGALAVNAHGIAAGTAVPFHGVPSVATEYWWGAGGTFATRKSADGDILWRQNGSYTADARYYIPPASWYKGACKLEVGNPLYPISGREIRNQPINWAISNGLILVTPSPDGKLYVSLWDPDLAAGVGDWATAARFVVFGATTAGDITAFNNITVMRNSPAEIVIRLSCSVNFGINWGRVTLDLSIRRGDRWLRCWLESDAQSDWGVRRDAVVACTALTGGIRQTADDSNHNRWILASADSLTTDLVNGKITISGGAVHNDFGFGIGYELAGSSAAGYDTAQNQIYSYMANQYETITVVGR